VVSSTKENFMMSEILNNSSASVLVHAIEANLFDYFKLFRGWPQGEVHSDPDMLWTISDVPFPLFNNVLCAQLVPENVNFAIETAMMRCKSRNVAMLWWTGPATRPADLGTYLEGYGFSREDDETGMAADLMKLNEDIPSPTGLMIEPVSDMDTLKEWIHVFTLGFGIPEIFDQAFFDLFASLGFGPELAIQHYLGRLNGAPVATSTLLLSAGVAGIYNVATLPNARRQGMGAAMTIVPLREARALGFLVGILQATEMGKRVYQHLGFQEYCKIGQYVWVGD
jgi:GNAT superfamily N-acetyltransferase